MSKFLSRSVFEEPLEHGYRLLPFRLSRLLDSRYLITNEAGEHLKIQEGELADFVNHRLAPTSEIYGNLKSKHFLIDDDSTVALQLLGLKVRTKIQRLADFTSLHMFVVSLRCEHSCPYCQVSRQSDDKVAYDMSEETAKKALDLAFRSPSPNIKIEFQGGEPLLNFDRVKQIVASAKEINVRAKRNLQFVIATNLALVTDEMLEFCRVQNILISTSLDGPADLHNTNRPRPGGNSHQLVEANLARTRNAIGHENVSALMTTTKKSLPRVREIIDEYLRLEFPGIFLRPLSPYGFAVKTKWFASYQADDWLNFYFDGLDYIIELNRVGVFFKEFMATTILKKILTPYATSYVDLMSPAGMGIAAVVYNYDGDVYASDEGRMLAEMGDHTFRLGNVHRNSYEEIFTSEALLNPLEESFSRSVPMCSECAFEPFCGSEPVFHHATQGDFIGHKPTSAFCNRNMAIFNRLFTLLDDPQKRPVLESWVFQ